MVFVTVGTHEQQFDRLIKAVDGLVAEGILEDDVFMQTGYSTYVPKQCEYASIIPYEEMQARMKRADVVVCHGGPSTFMAAMTMGKVPVVVPRQHRFGEHVNDHQVDFVREVDKRQGGIIAVYDIDKLSDAIEQARGKAVTKKSNNSNNERFCVSLSETVSRLLYGGGR